MKKKTKDCKDGHPEFPARKSLQFVCEVRPQTHHSFDVFFCRLLFFDVHAKASSLWARSLPTPSAMAPKRTALLQLCCSSVAALLQLFARSLPKPSTMAPKSSTIALAKPQPSRGAVCCCLTCTQTPPVCLRRDVLRYSM